MPPQPSVWVARDIKFSKKFVFDAGPVVYQFTIQWFPKMRWFCEDEQKCDA